MSSRMRTCNSASVCIGADAFPLGGFSPLFVRPLAFLPAAFSLCATAGLAAGLSLRCSRFACGRFPDGGLPPFLLFECLAKMTVKELSDSRAVHPNHAR